MLFNSLQFAVFLPIVFLLYWMIPTKYRWIVLLLSSVYFYMSFNAKTIFLILMTTLISYASALMMSKQQDTKKKKMILIGTTFVCLGVLFLFKYLNFFFDTLTALFSIVSIPIHPMTVTLMLPVGISFYTFQTLSYVMDVYHGKIEPERHFGVYAAYISFFPAISSGPIERAANLIPQIKHGNPFNYTESTYGLKLMAWGFFKKLVIADNLAVYVDLVYDHIFNYSGFALVLATLFFTVQIYCDFSGYSDIAKGVAHLFGIRLTQNFKSPYFSCSIKEFWSRWHISLSTWFKDYVYIPLGGNRCSKVRQAMNLLVTFLVSGAWHGASWTYILWGTIHGVGQVIENHLHLRPKQQLNKVQSLVRFMLTMSFVVLTWIFFRARSLNEVIYLLTHFYHGISSPLGYLLGGLQSIGLSVEVLLRMTLFVVILFVYDYASLKCDVIEKISAKPFWIRYPIYYLIVMAVLFFHAVGEVSFVYFQF